MKRMFRIPFRGQIRLASMAFHHAWCPLRRPGPGPLGTQVAAPTGQAQNGCPPRAAWHRNPRVTPLGPRGSRPFGGDSLPVPACGARFGVFWPALAPASLTLPYSRTPLFVALKNIAPHSDLDGALWPGSH